MKTFNPIPTITLSPILLPRLGNGYGDPGIMFIAKIMVMN